MMMQSVPQKREPLKALIIEDVEDDVLMLVRELRRMGFDLDYRSVDREDDLVEALQNVQQGWQIVFSDFSMPTFNGLDALKLVRQYDQDIPFIFVSGTLGEDKAVDAVKSGAQDYITKDNLKRLHAAVPRELREAVNRRERQAAKGRLVYLANYDELTSLPNRTLYQRRLNQAIELSAAKGLMVGIMHIHLDRFRDISSSLGPDTGDELLKQVALRLLEQTATEQVAAHISDAEFSVILPSLGHQSELIERARCISESLQSPITISGYELHVEASIGVSIYPLDGQKADELEHNATMAMHQAQRNGGNGCKFFSSRIREDFKQRLDMEKDLRDALERQELVLNYQPQVELASGRLVAVEALLRWTHPQLGPIPPDKFIPIAEASGLILPIGQWVLSQACHQYRIWRDHFGTQQAPRMAVNFSAFQFRQRELGLAVKDTLDEYGLDPHCLEVEITESALMQNPESAMKILSKLRHIGVTISLDDFGTGYSSLSYLKRFPVNVLKIDKSFIDGLPGDTDDVAIIRAILSMANHLNLDVVAEGIETSEQLDFLRNEGCALVQGYYLQRPILAEHLEPLIALSQPFAAKLLT
jgi:diguanylate cyclase (GGDEF)-like protein